MSNGVPGFEALIQGANSVVAAHTVARVLVERLRFNLPADIEAFIEVSASGNNEAKRIAKAALKLIADRSKLPIHLLSDSDANAYVAWLSEHALTKAAEGRPAQPDLGRTLLTELRKVGTG